MILIRYREYGILPRPIYAVKQMFKLHDVSVCLQVTPFRDPPTDDGILLYLCHEQWPKPTARQFFTVTSLVLQYVVPVILITYCYCSVSVALNRRARARASITGRTTGGLHHGDREQVWSISVAFYLAVISLALWSCAFV